MNSTLVKKPLLCLSFLILVSLACDLSVTVVPTNNPAHLPTNTALPATAESTALPTIAPVTVVSSATAATMPASFDGIQAAVDRISLVLPPGLASGVSATQFSSTAGQDLAYFEMTPGHRVLKLEGYLRPNKFHEPRIYVYPALPYAEMVPAAFESMHRLNNVLYDPNTAILNDQLPGVPFFNAAEVFASNVQLLSFQNGRGVRFVTQYAQYAAPVNNHELFYHFQGFSADGEYYLVAILPITMPALVENSDPAAALPSGGIPYPDMANPNADFPGYYTAVTNQLNETTSEIFTPNLRQLDLLIQSLQIAE